MWTAIIKWVWDNKLATLLLVALMAAFFSMAYMKTALSVKASKIVKQEEKIAAQQHQITELQLIQKENEANIAALKNYADQQKASREQEERTTIYLSALPLTTVEILNDERIKNINHCLFSYFYARVLPDTCGDKSK